MRGAGLTLTDTRLPRNMKTHHIYLIVGAVGLLAGFAYFGTNSGFVAPGVGSTANSIYNSGAGI